MIRIILLLLAIIGLAIPIISVNASDINCEERPDHEYCTGEEGKTGIVFCDLPAGIIDDCYDRENKIDCDENPNHKWCTGKEGIDGWEYCDLKTERKDCKDKQQ